MASVLTRAEVLATFLDGIAARPFKLGEFDCGLMPADWCKLITGIDPAAPIRKTYCTEEGWHRLVEDYGGLLGLWDHLGRLAAFPPTVAPNLGDVGVIREPGGALLGSILGASGRWLVKTDRNVVGWRCRPIMAWRVGECRRP